MLQLVQAVMKNGYYDCIYCHFQIFHVQGENVQ